MSYLVDFSSLFRSCSEVIFLRHDFIWFYPKVISPLPPYKQRVGAVPRAIIVAESPGICGSKNLRLRDRARASEVDITVQFASEETEENKKRKNIL